MPEQLADLSGLFDLDQGIRFTIAMIRAFPVRLDVECCVIAGDGGLSTGIAWELAAAHRRLRWNRTRDGKTRRRGRDLIVIRSSVRAQIRWKLDLAQS